MHDPSSALIIVDVQNDFCPGGALGVPEGDKIIPVINQYISRFHSMKRPVFASRDWHPQETKHFVQGGGPWPPHCIQSTPGAEFHSDLKLDRNMMLLTKGQDPVDDGYSCFEAINEEGLYLADVLKQKGIQHIYVCGLATDYCVKATVLDGLNGGWQVTLLLDAVRGVNVHPHDSEEAIEQMVRKGANVATLETF